MKKFLLILSFVFLAATPTVVFGQQGDFQPLTGLPFLENVGSGEDGLTSFFNRLYVLAVGAAAVIAVAQIMIAGFRWATSGGSHSQIEEARQNIQNSVLGLVLVLSPTIVFGIINPDILSLKIDTGNLSRPNVGEYDTTPTPREPLELENTCTDDAIRVSLQSNLDNWRAKYPTTPWTASWGSEGFGQAGVGCCRVVKDQNGASGIPKTATSFTPSGTLITTYTCSAAGSASPTTTGFAVEEFSMRVKGTPYTFTLKTGSTEKAFSTLAECQSTTGYTQDLLLRNLKDGSYACVTKNNGLCQDRVNEVKSAQTVEPNALSLVSRTCVPK